MEEWAEKFGWKKVTALFIIVAILILIFVIVSMFQSNSSETASAPNQITPAQNGSGLTNEGENGSGSENPSNPQTPSSFKKYSAQKFSFSYPSGYQASVGSSSAQNEVINLKGPQNINIDMHLYPGSTPASSIVGDFVNMGFRIGDFESGDYVGKMYTGKLLSNPPVQAQLVVLTSDFVIFGALLTYQSSAENTDIENNFQQVVRSVRFSQ